jgi:hypothetical protein
MRLLSAAGRGDFRRRALSRCAISVARRFCSACSIASSNRSRASFRFCACERESCTVTLIPLDRCRSVTAVATLFTFCPPGPPDRANVSSRSSSRMPMRRIRSVSSSFTLLHYSITRLSLPGCFRVRAEELAPSRSVHSEICPAAGHNFDRASFHAHRRAFPHFRN